MEGSSTSGERWADRSRGQELCAWWLSAIRRIHTSSVSGQVSVWWWDDSALSAVLSSNCPGGDTCQCQQAQTWALIATVTQLSVWQLVLHLASLGLWLKWLFTGRAGFYLFIHPCFADKMTCAVTATRSEALECESELGCESGLSATYLRKGMAMFLKAIHSQPFWGLIRDLAVLSIMAFHMGCKKLQRVTRASSMQKSSWLVERQVNL